MSISLELNSPFSNRELKRVFSIEFGVLSPELIRKYSVLEVKISDIYENGRPKSGGLNDPLLGTIDYHILCETCHMDIKSCPGHFAHIELGKPMFHIGFINTVLKLLRCVCYACSKLFLDTMDPRFKQIKRVKNPRLRLKKIFDIASSIKRCVISSDGSGCGFIQPTYSKEGYNLYINQTQDEGRNVDDDSVDSKRLLTAEEVLTIFKRITNEDMRILGFDPNKCNPSWFISTVIPIPPPSVRPYVQFGSDRSEDDLTLKLQQIVKLNENLKKQIRIGSPEHIINEMTTVLQYHLITLINNDLPGLPQSRTRSNRPIKSLRARLKGKDGRIRGNLMGKRVDFSARTVITGDPNLAVDQVGVPFSIAMTLTYPEIVTPYNIEELRELVQRGPNEWPGATSIIQEDGTKIDLRFCGGANNMSTLLQYGWKVERHMKNDDLVLFNRQPSLHKMSIMGHRVKILPYSTFRLNLSVTSPYNADFDGDEMNLHLAQSHETRSEIKNLMMVPRQIVSPQGNKPVIGIVQDSLLGIFLLTRRSTFLTKEKFLQLLLCIPYWNGVIPPPAILRPQPLWTGKQIITVLLAFTTDLGEPIELNLMRDGSIVTIKQSNNSSSENKDDSKENIVNNPWISELDNQVLIQKGEHICGVLTKKIAGSSSGSLIHILWNEIGPEKTGLFLTYTQMVVNTWLLEHGFTVGCQDIQPHSLTLEKIMSSLEGSKLQVQQIIRKAQRGKLDCQPGKSLIESFEAQVNQELNSAREISGTIATENLDSSKNNIVAMVQCGSKGSMINISQIMACVGQQNVEGKRIPFGFRDRSLPHFLKYDYGPESRGFVSNSYLSGLTPQEVFFHAMGGREGIIDTACKTSETGYIQRRLIKAMEDCMVQYDRTVRNSSGDIIQFLYGEDGMAGEFIEDQVMELLQMEATVFQHKYRHNVEHPRWGSSWNGVQQSLIKNLQFDLESQNILNSEYKQLVVDREQLGRDIFPDGETRQHLPININRIIQMAQQKFPRASEISSNKDWGPVFIAKKVESLLDRLLLWKNIGVCNENNSNKANFVFDSIIAEVQKNATTLLGIHIRSALASKKILEVDRLGPTAFEWILGEIEHQFYRSLVHSGEMVGTIAAQSIGEPATQMTLNTFHFAGVGSKNVTLGVPRLRELINVAKNVRTPTLTVYLESGIANDQEQAKDVLTLLEHTTLQSITTISHVLYDPIPDNTFIAADKAWVSDYYEFPDDADITNRLGRWLLRVQLKNKQVTDKKLSMKEIGDKILMEFNRDELDCIWTDDNSDELVLRIRIKNIEPNTTQVDGNLNSSQENENNSLSIASGVEENKFLEKLMIECLSQITLRGIHNIKKVYMKEEQVSRYDCISQKMVRDNQWVLDTDGCNLEAVLCHRAIDSTRTVSNDITEVFTVLGIEAVRRALLRELRTVISFDGSYVNYRHLALLCDNMTQKGHLMSITRHGINRVDRGPLQKCSFEETVEVLMDAAMFGETDYLNGISENVMLGQLAPYGTACFDVLIDSDKLRDTAVHLDVHNDFGKHGKYSTLSRQKNIYESSTHESSSYDNSSYESPMSPISPMSPLYNSYEPMSPVLSGQFSPVQMTPRSPMSPVSPSGIFSPVPYSPMSPTSPLMDYTPTSPIYANNSPKYNSEVSERARKKYRANNDFGS
ncbi:DNA-directed RNA polymerase II largest chain, partial [Cryptosporidium bovis]|uniref:DNA-directed RNA polymerase II largest chain n=1 Tax=Cryptosporidium bovis TaxID=310047 RepID=UPI00351A688A